MQDMFDLVRIVASSAVLVSACIGDWKEREVSDIHWAALGSFGIICMIYTSFVSGMRPEYVMQIAGSAMILASVLFEIEKNIPAAAFYSVMAALFVIPHILAPGDGIVMRFTSVPILFVIFLGMFASGMIKGGADAKCLITMAMVLQTYPKALGMPMVPIPSLHAQIFPFTVAVLMHACLFTVLFIIYYLAVNIKRRDIRVPQMFMGYRSDMNKAAASHVWPMETVIDGTIRTTTKAQDPGSIALLRQHGAERIWVTPMVPFIIPLTAAFMFVSFIGNLAFLPF